MMLRQKLSAFAPRLRLISSLLPPSQLNALFLPHLDLQPDTNLATAQLSTSYTAVPVPHYQIAARYHAQVALVKLASVRYGICEHKTHPHWSIAMHYAL